MRNFEICVDKNNNLLFLEIYNSKFEKPHLIATNQQVYSHINDLSKLKIVDIYEYENGEDFTLNYNNFSVYIKDYKKVFKKAQTHNLILSIKKYEERKELLKLKRKKVTRINKHSKKKIFIGGLVLALVASTSILTTVQAFEQKQPTYSPIEKAIIDLYPGDYKAPSLEMDDNETIKDEFVDSDIIVDEIINNETLKDNVINGSYDNYDENIEQQVEKVFLNYEDRSETDKALLTKSLYGDIIEKYSKMYGLDSSLVTAIATQERGIHAETMDRGGATGLMQIQNSVWDNESLSAYNYETNSNEILTVDIDNLSNVDYNIKVGCMILQNTINYMNNNVFAGIQCYNMGYGNMNKILDEYSYNSGKSKDEILNSNDLGWLECRNIIPVGDQEYLENVLSWMGSDIEINNYGCDSIYITSNNQTIKR